MDIASTLTDNEAANDTSKMLLVDFVPSPGFWEVESVKSFSQGLQPAGKTHWFQRVGSTR